ncbi:peptide ABC transporter ATP-binding protein [Cohnella kolymensis]|uniref:Peptide ABC transporter ATP-binding protein n=1 Tax=Cohnella kolymensis TaxID=1590652 RepID=A0ABR5A344_9BACL|nr:ABC transporter ATP-binding protein [Cohnella kolymensis]KIL35362.1 peptide ABC transporter ATP-binding protein [Cohnella kolymensis]
MSETVLSIQHLSISFKTSNGMVNAIRGLDLDLYKGKTLAIVGESGSGKSVTVKAIMRILSGNQKINSGSIIFNYDRDGEKVSEDLLKLSKKEMRSRINGRRIAMVFQDPMTSLNPTMTIGKQIMESMIIHQLKKKRTEAYQRALELLRLVGITDPEKRMKNYPHQLSGGMRQRVVIAIMLACDPEVLICDEPTTALDVTIQAKILELIKEIQAKTHISVIYITHDLGVVAKVADYVAVMYAGKIVERGTVNEIFYDPKHPYTWGLLSSMPDIDSENEKLYTIPGSPPNLLHKIEGDAFAPRNVHALKIDFKQEPPMFKVTDTHYAATWLLHENAPKVEMSETLRRRIDKVVKEAGSPWKQLRS